ncbi:MAG: hypothetical protein ACRDIC_01960 [bacterium]
MVLLGVVVIVCGLILPRQPATLLLSLALVPAAPRLGLEPWVVGFIVLGIAATVVTLIAIAASVPFWRAIGLLAP